MQSMKAALLTTAVGGLILTTAFLLSGRITAGQSAGTKNGDPQPATRETLEKFVAAFNANDAKTLGTTLAPGMEYIDESSQKVEGGKSVTEMLSGFFKANPGVKIQITPDGIRLVAPTVALEDAESVITIADKGKQTARRVSFVYGQVEGEWKIVSIREFPEVESVPEVGSRLKELAWLEGTWLDESGDAVVETTFTFSKDGSHMTREFIVRTGGQETLKGTQRISVDPQTGVIRSWTFDSLGGHGDSVWTKNGDGWLIRGKGVTGQGKEASATYLLKPIGKDRIEFQAVHRVVGDQVEPDTTTVLTRKISVPKR